MCLFLEIISVFSFSFTLKIWGFNRGVDRKAGHRSCCWYDSKTMLLCWNYVKVEVCARRTPSRHPSEWPVQTGVFVCLPLGGPRHLRLFRRAADLIKPTFNPDQLISRQLMRCEQIGTGPCPAGTPQRGAGPPRTAVRLYNYMSFVWAWSVFPQGLSVRSFASAGMLLLLSCSSQHSHKVLLMCPVDFDFYIFLHRFVQKVQRVLNKNLQNVFFYPGGVKFSFCKLSISCSFSIMHVYFPAFYQTWAVEMKSNHVWNESLQLVAVGAESSSSLYWCNIFWLALWGRESRWAQPLPLSLFFVCIFHLSTLLFQQKHVC